LALDILVTLVLAFLALNKYGRLRERFGVTLIVLLTWFFSFAIVLVLPLDVSWVSPFPILLSFFPSFFFFLYVLRLKFRPFFPSLSVASVAVAVWREREKKTEIKGGFQWEKGKREIEAEFG
jgi:hypothetical protein